MPFVIREQFRRDATKSADNVVFERGWTVWKETSGVIVASEADEIFTAMNGTVQVGSAYPSLGGLKCVEVRPSSRDDIEIWDVSARYEIPKAETPPDSFSQFMSQSQNNSPENPFGPEFSGGGQTVEEYRVRDLDGRLFVNSAKQPFRNLVPIPVTIQVDRVTVSQANPANTANQGRADGRRLLASVSYQSAEHVNKQTGVRTRYYKNTYEVWTHPDRDWARVEVIDAGFKQIKNGKLVTIVDPATKEPYSEESLLNGAGGLLGAGADPQTIEFRIRNEGALGVPFLG
ncbi:MAG: hypothetical protein DCC68_04990 [Planctomycetota bacterium]|nr:MAG: hypothetical protein DCC68_04990 [Planctomycetota bacterium]